VIGHVATVLFEKSNDLILQVVLPGGHAPRIAHLRDDRPCQGRPERFTEEQRRRLAVKGHALGRKALRELDPIVTPDTILRWYRELITEKYDGSQQRKPGRPRTPDELRDLVTRMAHENPGWGYTRIRDALGNLGYELARTTIRSILQEHGRLCPRSRFYLRQGA
jgi:hypothetical protein